MKKSGMFSWTPGTIAVAVLLVSMPAAVTVIIMSAGSADKPEPAVRRANVEVLTVKRDTIEDRVMLPVGAESPEGTFVKLSAEMAGRVVSITKREGDPVAKGELIANIDTEMLDAQLKEAKAVVAEAEAGVKEAKASVELESATQREAKAKYDRAKTLAAKGHRSKEDLETAKAVFERAKAAHDRAESALVRASAGKVRAQATVTVAQVACRRGEVRSPINGRLDRRYVDGGEYIKEGDPVADVVNTERLYAVVHLPEADRQHVAPGDKVVVTFTSVRMTEGPGLPFVDRKAVVRSVSEVGDELTRTYRAQIEFENPGGKVKPGMIGVVSILRRRFENVVVVPIDVVVSNESERLVYLAVDGKVVGKRITIGLTDGRRFLVTSGLAGGEQVLREPRQVSVGEMIRVRLIDGKTPEGGAGSEEVTKR